MSETVISIKSRAVFARASAALYAASDDDAKIAFVAAAAGELAHDLEALGRLSESAINVHGLPPDAVQAAIVKGIKKSPRKRRREMQFTPLSEIDPTPVRWLWPDRVARKFVLFCGPPDVGKTCALLDVAARVSRGDPWPDGGGNAPLGSVLYMTAEDGAADTIRTRAEAAGADLAKVHVLQSVTDENGKASSFNLQRDLDLLTEHVRRIGDVVMVAIDPIAAYLGDNKDSHKASDVRGILSPLKDFSEEHAVAVVGLAHPSKSVDRAMNAVGGSGAFVAASRATWLFVREVDGEGDETGRTLMLSIKNNLSGRRNNGLAYRIVGCDLGNGISAPRVSWDHEPVNVTADQALAMSADATGKTPDGGNDALATAMKFIEEEFLAKERIEAVDLVTWAKRAGISESTLRRAKQKLGIVSKRDGFGEGSKWYLSRPEGAQD
jgi:putative DNA primase/helicase